jgi:hypothetical protein
MYWCSESAGADGMLAECVDGVTSCSSNNTIEAALAAADLPTAIDLRRISLNVLISSVVYYIPTKRWYFARQKEATDKLRRIGRKNARHVYK